MTRTIKTEDGVFVEIDNENCEWCGWCCNYESDDAYDGGMGCCLHFGGKKLDSDESGWHRIRCQECLDKYK